MELEITYLELSLSVDTPDQEEVGPAVTSRVKESGRGKYPPTNVINIGLDQSYKSILIVLLNFLESVSTSILLPPH